MSVPDRHLALAREPLSSVEARRLTDEIKSDAERLWGRLLEAYEGGAHTALGFSSWGDYCKAEFGTSGVRGYQLLGAGRVVRAIDVHSTTVSRPRTESVARPLAHVLKHEGEEAAAEVWDMAVEEHGPDPTEEEVRETVDRVSPRRSRKALDDVAKFGNALTSAELAANYIRNALKTLDLDSVSEETRIEWARQTRVVDAAANQLRRRFTRR